MSGRLSRRRSSSVQNGQCRQSVAVPARKSSSCFSNRLTCSFNSGFIFLSGVSSEKGKVKYLSVFFACSLFAISRNGPCRCRRYPRATQCWPSASCELQKPQAASVHASGGGRIPEPPKVAAVTTEAQQRRRAVLILYCTLTLSRYALLLVTCSGTAVP